MAPATEDKLAEKRRWRLWQIESAMACNLDCIMCPWKAIRQQTERNGIMSQVIWEGLRPHLPEVRSIDFSGGGEPLLQPRLAEWIMEAKSAGCETGFLTNGVLLTKVTARQMIGAGVDWIGFSMDGATADIYERVRKGSSFERLCENLTALNSLRVGKVSKTMINFVMMPMNFHQVEEIVKLAARLGVDQVNFKQCDVIRGEQGKGYGLFATKENAEVRSLKKALSKAQRLARKRKLHTTAFSFTPDEQPVCAQDPRESLFIRHDGSVAPCINLAYGGPTIFLGRETNIPTVHYGRLPEQGLLDLWESDPCKTYRERFQRRVQAHDARLFETLLDASWPDLQGILHAAAEAMPEAPEGCEVCHYLYDI